MKRDYEVYVGVDVGKSTHHAYALTSGGEVLFDGPIEQDAGELYKLFRFAAASGTALVVVDQPKNIGALTLAKAREAGCHVAYLPGLAMSRAAAIFPGDSKTDSRDAAVIAKTAMGVPDALRPVADKGRERDAISKLAAYQSGLVKDRTHYINRIRAALSESNPAFERLCDFTRKFCIDLILKFDGPWGAKRAGRARYYRWANAQKHVKDEYIDAVWDAIASMDAPVGACADIEAAIIPPMARRIRELAEEAERVGDEIEAIIERDATYKALLSVPGIGRKTASVLVANLEIDNFPNCDALASYVGLAPRTRQSGTSLHSQHASRGGNKTLKRALYTSCTSLLLGDNPYHDYYNKQRAKGKNHGQAIKAVARKRLKVIYAVMRDKKPYSADLDMLSRHKKECSYA